MTHAARFASLRHFFFDIALGADGFDFVFGFVGDLDDIAGCDRLGAGFGNSGGCRFVGRSLQRVPLDFAGIAAVCIGIFNLGGICTFGEFGLGGLGVRCNLLADRLVLARILVASATAAPAASASSLALAFGLVVGAGVIALFLGKQRLPVRDRDLVVVRMDFAEGQKTVAVAAVFDERRL
jgi:hypothetical protein